MSSRVSPQLPKRMTGDQDQAPSPLITSPDQSDLGKLKIHFKVPFNHAELSKKIINPYFPFNPNKEDTNGKQIFKSPMLKTSNFQYGNEIYIGMGE
jgi:hypothetical protein